MSSVVLQRVVVRMLYDPGFQQRVYDDPQSALTGLDLTAVERGWLVQPDPRAWRTDPLRRTRSLTGLLEEFPGSAVLAVANHGEAGRLERFFDSPSFHHCIQQRGSLGLAFGRWLGQLGPSGGPRDRRLHAIVELELALARARRASSSGVGEPQSPPEEPGLSLAPGVGIVVVPAGGADLYAGLQALLARWPHPGEALASARSMVQRLPSVHPENSEFVLIQGPPASPGLGLEELPPALGELLQGAANGQSRQEFLAQARRLGADPGEDEELAASLEEDGLLVSRP